MNRDDELDALERSRLERDRVRHGLGWDGQELPRGDEDHLDLEALPRIPGVGGALLARSHAAGELLAVPAEAVAHAIPLEPRPLEGVELVVAIHGGRFMRTILECAHAYTPRGHARGEAGARRLHNAHARRRVRHGAHERYVGVERPLLLARALVVCRHGRILESSA